MHVCYHHLSMSGRDVGHAAHAMHARRRISGTVRSASSSSSGSGSGGTAWELHDFDPATGVQLR